MTARVLVVEPVDDLGRSVGGEAQDRVGPHVHAPQGVVVPARALGEDQAVGEECHVGILTRRGAATTRSTRFRHIAQIRPSHSPTMIWVTVGAALNRVADPAVD